MLRLHFESSLCSYSGYIQNVAWLHLGSNFITVLPKLIMRIDKYSHDLYVDLAIITESVL